MFNRIMILLFWICTNVAMADTMEGKVVGVSDGDTITILDSSNIQHKIRLAGIDAPEVSQLI